MDQQSEGLASAAYPCKIEKLPNELLESIFALLGSRFPALPMKWTIYRKMQDKQSWFSWSLVCRRWRLIALPGIFRWLRITMCSGSQTFEPYRGAATGASVMTAFASFLSSTPHVATLIEELGFCWLHVELPTLVAVLDLLPRLRHVVLYQVQQDYGAFITRIPRRYKLESLTYNVGAEHAPVTYMPNILSVFSDIGELNITSWGHYWLDENTTDSSLAEDKPTLRICRLILGDCAPLDLFYVFRQVNMLSFITHLTIRVDNEMKSDLKGLGKLLLKVGGTLQDLHLHLKWILDGPDTEYVDAQMNAHRERDPGVLKTGLAACTTLHSLRLVIVTDIAVQKPTAIADEHFLQRIAGDGWLVGAEIIGLVPAEHLRHFSYIYASIESGQDAHINVEPDKFNWHVFRAACSQFRDMLSFEAHLVGTHEDSNEPRAAYARRKLEELHGVVASSDGRCPEAGCRWRQVESAVLSTWNLNVYIKYVSPV